MPAPDLLTALRTHFAYPAFRPGQEEALTHVLNGRDALVVMPTGSGKSIIYQLAAMCLEGTALVISPLVALMKDQADSLTRRNLPATYVNSSLELAEQNRRLRGLVNGDYKIMLIAPERFRSVNFRNTLAQIRLSLLAVDEAHCLSQWGHDFRPDYLFLGEMRKQLQPPVTLALTATATPRVQDDILALLGLPRAERIITGFNRPNLSFAVIQTRTEAHKLTRLDELLAQLTGAGLIYVGTRREAEEVSAYIRDKHKRPVACYHAGLAHPDRARIQDQFMSGDLPLVVATNAFGMGIDRPDVRFVLHYTMPGTLEAYYQEAGRAGRDGLPADALLLYSPKDSGLHKFFIENASPAAAELRSLHEYIRALTDTVGYADIEQALNLKDNKARVALEQLESIGAVTREDEAYGRLRLTATPLTEAALRQLEKEVQARARHRFDLLGRMVDYAQTTTCRRRTLLKHFGDHAAVDVPPQECCDNCAQRVARDSARDTAPPRAAAPAHRESSGPDNVAPLTPLDQLTRAERAALIVLDAVGKLRPALGRNKLAQFLQGSNAEGVAHLKDRPYFAKFADLRVKDVEALIDQLLDSGHLQQGGGIYPVVQLTPFGEAALQNRAAISVSLRPARPGASLARQLGTDTVGVTAQLLGRGLTPAQIAAERGLAESTIYTHLATLIAEGKVDVNAVIPAETQQKIIAAIEAVGSVAYLTPIKAKLPDFTTYSEIRCVVEAWKRGQSQAVSAPSLAEAKPSLLSDIPFAALHTWRATLVTPEKPEWAILSNERLRKIAIAHPHTLDELRELQLLAADALEAYGAIIVALLKTESTEVSEAILACVRSLPGQLPRSGVAKLLVGSASERVSEYRDHPLYNRFPNHQRIEITAQVDALLERGVLAQDEQGHLIVKA